MVAFPAPAEKDSSRSTASFVPGTKAQDARGRSSFSRVMVSVRVVPSGARSSSATSVPSIPRTFETTSSMARPATLAPSTVTISSPAFNPARSAGLSRRTLTILTAPSCWSSTAPTPTKVPESESSRAATSSGVRYPVWPRSSRLSVIPTMAPRSRVSGSSPARSTKCWSRRPYASSRRRQSGAPADGEYEGPAPGVEATPAWPTDTPSEKTTRATRTTMVTASRRRPRVGPDPSQPAGVGGVQPAIGALGRRGWVVVDPQACPGGAGVGGAGTPADGDGGVDPCCAGEAEASRPPGVLKRSSSMIPERCTIRL